ncbi:erythromycin esterase family protein [Nocardia mexicana]|uniref:Erythromycin esterase n=1 Tax=Nocardia mexicana TaxID=279262 RepID=A0A370HDR3_9NOCA|nr:erythromycin esterase family protein [Nocardia mexicana]RDI55377.1 erythromycin esterase [Nocardia mexicana]
MTTTHAPELHDWLRTHARPVTDTRQNHLGDDLTPLTDSIATAKVVGLGESTRFSAQTYGVRDRIFRSLVREYGFRALALQDSTRAGERLDDYVNGGAGTAEAAVAGMWRPWRSAELVDTLTWIRAFNADHPADPVRIFGINPTRAEPSDYDAVLDHVRRAAPELLDAVAAHLDPIRTAHQIDEHVQRHQGIHPGRPFADHARDAVGLLGELPATPERETALAHARLILEFHDGSVAGRGSFMTDEQPAVTRILEWQRRTGARIAYWDGVAHTAAAAFRLGDGEQESHDLGSLLRTALGTEYLSVGIGFHHGDFGFTAVPAPAPDLVDALLGTVDLPAHYIDLRTAAPEPVQSWRQAPAALRVISGVYDPSKDDTARVTVTSLADAFDILVHIHEATSVRWLPTAGF